MRFTTELKVPADPAFVALVESVVADAARRSALNERQQQGAVAAARAGFIAIVDHAMAEAREPIRVVAACTPKHLCVSLFERGLPMDDLLARRDPQWRAITENVDEAHWHSHGTAGSELRLLMDHRHEPVEDAPACMEAGAEVPLAPEQAYTIRRFEPSDAPGIARAFYLTYGYQYDLNAVYDPSRLTELNALGYYVSIVAVAQDGEIVGHYALAREADDPIADGCGAIVLPAHRGRNLLNLLRSQAEREAIDLGLAAYYSEPVTDHGRTQHASESFGAKVCGITLGESPRSFLAKHMELSATAQRQSFMLYVKPLREREPRAVYAPARHREIVGRIYEGLGVPVEMGQGTAAAGRGAFHTGIVRADEIGQIVVERVGSKTADLLRQATEDLRSERRLGALYASLPLEDPGAAALCEAMEAYGFFFSGVGPWMLGGRDALRLQMPLTPIDLSALTVVGDFGKELLEYVRVEQGRAQAAVAGRQG